MAKETATPARRPGQKSAAPGSKDNAGQKPAKVKKVDYPGLADDAKLDAWPADFDAKLHKPLKKTDFTGEWVWLEHRASEFESKAADLRKEAEESRTLGSTAQRVKAKRLRKLVEQLAKLEGDLPEGFDVAAILASAREKVAAE